MTQRLFAVASLASTAISHASVNHNASRTLRAGRAVLFALLVGAAGAANASDEASLDEARQLMAQGQWPQAQRLLNDATDADKTEATRKSAWNLLASLHARQGRFDEARRALEQALAIDPDFDLAWQNLGDIHLGLALHSYRQALRLRSSPSILAQVERIQKMLGADIPDPETELLAALENWRAAWQARDVSRYLASYADNFQPPGGMTPAAWRKQRSERLAAAQSVRVTLEAVTIKAHRPGQHYTVRFTEHLEADGFHRTRRKSMEWERCPSGWVIAEES
jgi:tetratricopeptide (TPR) repeat protein